MKSQAVQIQLSRVQIDKIHPKVREKAKFSPLRAPGLTKLLSRLQKLQLELSEVKSEISKKCTHAEADLTYKEKHGTDPYHCRTFTHDHVLTCRVCGAILAEYDFTD